MLKKIAIVAALVALTGCATHQQANTAVGAGIGAVVGHAIGGSSGAVVGTMIGTAMGSQHPAGPPVVYAPVYPQVYQRREVCVLNQEVYNARVAGCDNKYRVDPRYTRHHWQGCMEQAKQMAWSCQ